MPGRRSAVVAVFRRCRLCRAHIRSAPSILLHCITHVALHLHMFEFYFIAFYCRILEILFRERIVVSRIVLLLSLSNRFIRHRLFSIGLCG